MRIPGALVSAASAVLLVLVLALPGCCDLEITTDALPPGVVGQAYEFELQSDCGGHLWLLSDGMLPPGIGLSSSGVLSGTPDEAGEFRFTVVLENSSGDVVFKTFILRVSDPQ